MGLELIFHTNEAINDDIAYIFCPTILRNHFLLKENIVQIITMKNEFIDCKIQVSVLTEDEYEIFLRQHYLHIPKYLIAVTGTKGKTSTTMHIAQMLSINYNVSAICSTGYYEFKNYKLCYYNQLSLFDNTTRQLGVILRSINSPEINIAVIEVSSIGITENRIGNMKFDISVFTNFYNDHLDYHKTLECYFNSKLYLMNQSKSIVLNDNLFDRIKHNTKYKFTNNRMFDIAGIDFHENFNAAITVCNIMKVTIPESLFKHLMLPIGRMNRINDQIMIDYSHNGSSLSNAIQKYKPAIVLFGCGGDKDKNRRMEMAIATQNIDLVIITNNLSRSENPLKIVYEIASHMPHQNYIIVLQRSRAIELALSYNKRLMISGMGNDKYHDHDGNETNDIQYTKGILFWKYFISNINAIEYKITEYFLPDQITYNTELCNKYSIFAAIIGKRDGHQFINHNLRYVIVDNKLYYDQWKNKIKNIFLVSNVMKSILQYGQWCKKQYIQKSIAITGTCGKTSSKDLLSYILDDAYSSTKSMNNELGVPFTLSNINQPYHYGIFELGINAPNEMHHLVHMVHEIDIGIITNIGPGHIGNFNNLEELEDEKTQLKAKSMIVQYQYANRYEANCITFGCKKSDIYIMNIKTINNTKSLIKVCAFGNKIEYSLNTLNIGQIKNSQIIWAIQKLYNLDLDLIIKRLSQFEFNQLIQRGNVIEINGIIILNDTYNSNPLSLQNSINHLLSFNCKRYIAVIGDMKEIGLFNYNKYLSRLPELDYILTYGSIDLSKYDNFYGHFNNIDEILQALITLINKGDVIMIKGSRAMNMEQIVTECTNIFS